MKVGSKPNNPITAKTLRAPSMMSMILKQNMRTNGPTTNSGSNPNSGGRTNGPTTKTYQPPEAPQGMGDVEK